jgi:hypothetical protein
MRSFIGVLAVVGVVGIACSSSSKGGAAGGSMWTDQCDSNGRPQTCTGADTFGQCVSASCDAVLKVAFGDAYASGTLAGPCGAFMACRQSCACGASYNTCQSSCATNVTPACGTALNNVTTCMNSAMCADPVCTTTGGSAGAGGYAGGGVGGYAGGSAGGAGSSIWTSKCDSNGQPQTCTGGPAYGQCASAACNSQLTAALGSGYNSSVYTGPCASYMTCYDACPCGASYNTCTGNCATNAGATCQSSMMTLATCLNSATCADPVCTTIGGAGGAAGAAGYGGYAGGIAGASGYAGGLGGTAGVGGGTGTYTCAQLSACCARITDPNYAPIKTACTTTVGYAVDAACSSVYTTYLTYCP